MSGPSLSSKYVLTLAILKGEIMHIIANWHIYHHEVVGINAYGMRLNALERKFNQHMPSVLELKTTNAKQPCGEWKQACTSHSDVGIPLSGAQRRGQRPLGERRICPLPYGGIAPLGSVVCPASSRCWVALFQSHTRECCVILCVCQTMWWIFGPLHIIILKVSFVSLVALKIIGQV